MKSAQWSRDTHNSSSKGCRHNGRRRDGWETLNLAYPDHRQTSLSSVGACLQELYELREFYDCTLATSSGCPGSDRRMMKQLGRRC